MTQNQELQSELLTYSENIGDEQHRPEPVFEGEINTRILEEVARNLSSPAEHILLNITPERVRFTSVEKQDDELNSVSQTGEIPAEEWESFSLNDTESYTAVIQPYQGIVKAFTSDPTESIIEVSCTSSKYSDFGMNVREHSMFTTDSEYGSDEPQTLDVFSVGSVTTSVLRNPNHNAFELTGLEYDSTITLENTFELKKWLRSNANADTDSVVLLALSTRGDSSTESSVVSFTEFCVETASIIDSLVLTGDEGISSICVTNEGKTNDVYGNELLPEEHNNNRLINFAFYDTSLLKNVFKHVLKESLEVGDFKIQFSHQYPLHISHVIKSVVDVETKSIATTTIAPVMVEEVPYDDDIIQED